MSDASAKRFATYGYLALALVISPELKGSTAESVFEKHVRPILANHCYECHYRESKGGLRLTSRQALLRGGNSGPAILQNDPENGLLFQAITRRHPEIQMPPKHALPEADLKILTSWLNRGAPWPEASVPPTHRSEEGFVTSNDRAFWAFQPVQNPLPPPQAAGPSIHPVDAFLTASQTKLGLVPLDPAPRHQLARRTYLDLIGLPPTIEELHAFESDPAPNAFAHLVDRLLADPRYGEHWGGHWLDLTRYADTAGDASDFPVPEAFRYRNYVIDAFNQDKPYGDFVREQIAGDLLPYADDAQRWEQIIATGYVATSRRVGVSPQNRKHIVIEDTLDNLGKTFLGLTIGCARCHDHKFDPISTADYYGLYGIFASSVYPHPGAEHQPYRRDFTYRIGDDGANAALANHRSELAPWDAKEREALRIYRLFQTEKITTPGLSRQSTWQDLLDIREQRQQVAEQFPNLEIAYSLKEGQAHDAAIMRGGDPAKRAQGAVVPRRFLTILGGNEVPPDTAGSGRRQLADWIADPANPLTYRVMANRIWHYHFGKGIVTTPSDFGIRGERPSHPELLDYLTSYFQKSKGSIKALHRHILMSAAYQRASAEHVSNQAIDPGNRYLWRFNRQRLSAEQLRDTVLTFGDQLDATPGQAHPFPHRLTYFYRQHEPFTENYPQNKRTVYRLRRRLEKDPYVDLFDGPDGNLHLDQRKTTTTSLQALYFMNGDFIRQQADLIAARLLQEQTTLPARLNTLFHQAYSRPITKAEQNRMVAFLEAQGGRNNQSAWRALCQAILSSNEFLFID